MDYGGISSRFSRGKERGRINQEKERFHIFSENSSLLHEDS